jgi:UMF1 family MFS transporter
MSLEMAASSLPRSLKKSEVLGWAMFDFANSSFTTVMVTAYFGVYFQELIVPPDADGSIGRGTALWGLCQSISQTIVILTAPLVGALADFTGAKKKFLFVTYIGCSLLTMALGWVGVGDIVLAMTLFIAANIFYSSGENLVGAFLPEIAPPEKMGRVSGFAWGLGYIGGIGSLLLSVAILDQLGEDAGYPWLWIMIGAWFLLAGIPMFALVPERRQPEVLPAHQTIWSVGFRRLFHTLREAGRFRQLFRFLIIYTIISAGITAVISFASRIARDTLNFDATRLGIFLIVTNLVAVAGAWGWGPLQDRIGSVWAIRLSLLCWLAALGIVLLIKPPEQNPAASVPGAPAPSTLSVYAFWIAGCFVGLGMGASLSSCRAVVGLFSPPDRSGEFFGLWGLFGKLGTVFGPVSFGWAYDLANDIRVAEVVVGAYFIAGFLLLALINEAEGRQAARAPVSA